MTFLEAYDQDLLSEGGNAPQPTLQAGGSYTSFVPQVALATHIRPLQFNGFGVSSFRYYPAFSQALATNYNIGGGVSAKAGRRTSMSANAGINYAPTPLYALFAGSATATATPPDASATAAAESQVDSLRSYTSTTSVALEQTLNRRVALTALGNVSRTQFFRQSPGFTNMESSDAGGRVTVTASRHVNLRFGFVQRVASYSEELRTSEQDLEVGVAVTKELSATRRLTFGVNLGPTASQIGPAVGRQFLLTGDAFIERQIGRSWTARSTYRRGVTYVGGLAGPAYTDTATVEAGGFLNRHVDVSASGAFASGRIASQLPTGAKFTSFMAFATLRYGLSRAWAVHIEGLFYDYQFDLRAISLPGVPDRTTRSGVRAGLTMLLPLRADRVAR